MTHVRTILMVSLLANLGLGILAVTLWLQCGVEPEESCVAHGPVVDLNASPFPRSPNPGTDPGHMSTASEPFTWQQIESEDYREYMTNLRGLGCPERLIRDLIVAAPRPWMRIGTVGPTRMRPETGQGAF